APGSDSLAALDMIGATGNPDVEATAAAVAQMMSETQFAMSSVAAPATQRTRSIVSELSGLGIEVHLPQPLDGVGGPLLAAMEDGENSPMIEDANAVMAALLRYRAARNSIDTAPIHMPISGSLRQSSGFGNRTDPFSGGR